MNKPGDFLRMLLNINGWHTKSKYVVIASDDWGGIRNSTIQTRQNLIKLGLNMEDNRFDKYDILESNKDMDELFNVLLKYKDFKGNHPVFSAITNVANPDFEKIKASDFTSYFYEVMDVTLAANVNSNKVFEYYKKGIELNIFRPELHGREHLQVNWLMQDIQNRNSLLFKVFENKYWYLSQDNIEDRKRRWYGAAFDIEDFNDIDTQKQIIADSTKLFSKLFGYDSIYFTPPSGIFNEKIEKELFTCGVKLIDVPIKQKMPLGNSKYKLKIHYTGQKSNSGLHYLIRNALFEPNLHGGNEAVDVCLSAMETNFKLKLPVIISNHRTSFVGGIDVHNRETGLKSFDNLLKRMLVKWPDIEFVNLPDLYANFLNRKP